LEFCDPGRVNPGARKNRVVATRKTPRPISSVMTADATT
jgi:hypothetical protein